MSDQTKMVINDESMRRILDFLAGAATVAMTVATAFRDWMAVQNDAYERAALKSAYSRRKKWKVSDVANLRALPNARISSRRLAALEGSKRRGRPVVRPYRSLPEALFMSGQCIRVLFDEVTPPHQRLRALRQTGLWPHLAEALYRGCYTEAKSKHMPSPSVEAERMAANSMSMSEALLRKLCQRVRQQRKAEKSEVPSPISLDAFEKWKLTGHGLLE